MLTNSSFIKGFACISFLLVGGEEKSEVTSERRSVHHTLMSDTTSEAPPGEDISDTNIRQHPKSEFAGVSFTVCLSTHHPPDIQEVPTCGIFIRSSLHYIYLTILSRATCRYFMYSTRYSGDGVK